MYVAGRLVGREGVVRRLVELLTARHYASALLVAPRGSGKSAVLGEVARRLGGAGPAPGPWGRCGATAIASGSVIIMDDPQRRCGVATVHALAKSAARAGARYVVATSDPRVAGLAGHWQMPPYAVPVGMWNMARGEFEELYHAARRLYPGAPPFEDAWAAAGGNPKLLLAWARRGWDFARLKSRLAAAFGPALRAVARRGLAGDLLRATDDPDDCGRACWPLWLSGLMSLVTRADVAPNRALGVGRYMGWAAPALRDVAAAVATRL